MKTNISNKDNNYSLHNLENYKKKIDTDIAEVTEKYYKLLLEYYKFIIENIKIKNENLTRFIIIRGLDTITNVFNNIFYYTKNIDMTYFHCQKSFYFYVEFVGQISEDEKMFLQLTSRDATTYVYKKTIFEINNDCKKNIEKLSLSSETNDKILIINNYNNIYKTLLYKIIQSEHTNENISKNLSYIDLFERICEKINKTKFNKENIVILNNIIDNFYFSIIDINYFYEVIQYFFKKSKLHNLKNCEKNMYTKEMQDKLVETPEKYVMWFLS
jgi:hypothetical protein